MLKNGNHFYPNTNKKLHYLLVDEFNFRENELFTLKKEKQIWCLRTATIFAQTPKKVT